MATVLNTYYGAEVGPSPQKFRVVYQLGYSQTDNIKGWYLQGRMYVEVTNGQSSVWTSNCKPSWQDSRVSLSTAGIYADSGWLDIGWVARDKSHTFACSASYTGGSGTVYKSEIYETYETLPVTAVYINYRGNYADTFGSGWNTANGFTNCAQSAGSLSANMGTYPFYINQAYPNGLHNYSHATSATYAGRRGYNATGYWNTKPDGSGVSIGENTAFANGGDIAYLLGVDIGVESKWVDMYPMWTPWKHTVVFDTAGGSGTFASQTKTYGSVFYIDSKTPVRNGYEFIGWLGSNGKTYNPGQAYDYDQNGGTVVLTAQWKASYNCHVNDGGTWRQGMAFVCNANGQWQQGWPHINDAGTWRQGS